MKRVSVIGTTGSGETTFARNLAQRIDGVHIELGALHWESNWTEAAANLLTNDALDPQAKIPEFKACAVQVFPAREDELANPEVEVRRGRY